MWERCVSGLVSGFEIGSLAGLLCEEPLFSYALKIKQLDFLPSSLSTAFSGNLIGCVKDGFRLGALSLPQRLVEPFYICQFQCSQEQLGKMYGVLAKRRGKILDENLIEGTTLFTQVIADIGNS